MQDLYTYDSNIKLLGLVSIEMSDIWLVFVIKEQTILKLKSLTQNSMYLKEYMNSQIMVICQAWHVERNIFSA